MVEKGKSHVMPDKGSKKKRLYFAREDGVGDQSL